jgi:hypothetical protein
MIEYLLEEIHIVDDDGYRGKISGLFIDFLSSTSSVLSLEMTAEMRIGDKCRFQE